MNRIDFDQTGGYRLETESLSKLQSNYRIFEALGEVVGEKSIIKGCNVVGSTTTDGVVFFNGELLDFVGGTTQSTIIIVEEVSDLLFEDGQNKPTFYKRYARFGTGANSVLWSEFNRAYPLSSALYIDKIDMYAGDIDSLPEGWFLCNGQNGTVDLRQRFVVGLDPNFEDYDEVGKIGGLKEVQLNENELPTHDFSGNFTIPPHTMEIGITAGTDNGGGRLVTGGSPQEGSIDVGITSSTQGSFNTQPIGGDAPHENRPPFYTLAFIQFKGI